MIVALSVASAVASAVLALVASRDARAARREAAQASEVALSSVSVALAARGCAVQHHRPLQEQSPPRIEALREQQAHHLTLADQ